MAGKFQKLEAEYQHLLTEYNILKCKLECKTEGLLILSHEQAKCCSERDQYKLMAEQLRERYNALRKRVEGWGPSLLGAYDVQGFKGEREQSLVQLLCELKEQNKSLQHEVDDLKQKLTDAQGDIKILRNEISRSRSNSLQGDLPKNLSQDEKETLVKQLEVFRHKCKQLERDLEAILDEKEELVTARDAYRHKFERLNQQLNCLLRGDQPTYVDIDGVIMENRYLQERIKQVIEEKNMATAALSKCKALLEKKRAGSGFQLSTIASGLAISARQVEHLLQNNHFLDKVKSSDFRNLLLTLLEALSDKTVALLHQRRTNKILGNRVSELEQKIKMLEATSLWQFRDANRLSNVLKMDDVHDGSSSEELTPQHSVVGGLQFGCTSPISSESALDSEALEIVEQQDKFLDVETTKDFSRSESNFSDLDLLPTKDYSAGISLTSPKKNVLSCRANSFAGSMCTIPAVSPVHRNYAIHSDSELSPKRPILRICSSSSLPNPSTHEERDPSSLDIEDLPPKLQELLVAALAELDENSCDKNTRGRSPKKEVHFPIEPDDPSC